MEFLDNITAFGQIESNNFIVKDTITHSLVATNTTYTIALNGKMKHIVDLQNAPSNVTLDISGGDEDVLMGIIVLKQSTASVKSVTWNVNNCVKFDDFSGAVSTEKIYYFHYHNKYQNMASEIVLYDDIKHLTKSLTTPTATTTCSLENTSYASLNITQNTEITFGSLKDGVIYTVIITQTGTNTVTFQNLLTASGTALALSGGTDLIQIMKNPSNASQVLLVNKQLNLS